MTFFVRHKIPLLLLFLGLMLFANTLDGKILFSWDDNRYLTENQIIQEFQINKIFSESYFGSYIPVTLLSYAVEHLCWGFHPAGYHAVNVMLHAVNGVLVFFFLFLLTGRRVAAAIGAILFIVHPLQVESVAWISQRKNLLCMLFFLLAFISHIHSRKTDAASWLWAAWLFFLLSVLSKPAVVGAPLLFMAYDYFWARLPLRRILLSAIVPFAIAAFGAAAILITSAQVGGIKEFWGGSRWSATQLTFLATWENLLALIWPTQLSPHYVYYEGAIDGNWRVWAGFFLLLAFTAIGLRSLRKFMRHKDRAPMGFFLYLWVVVFMLPVSNIVPIAIQRSDRHLYFPSVLIFLMIGLLWHRWWQRYQGVNQRHVLIGGVVAVTLLFAVTTYRQNRIWTDSGTLWRYQLQHHPSDDIAINNLAFYYFRTGQYFPSRKIYTDLARLTPLNFKPYLFMGLIDLQEEQYDDAIRYLHQAMPLADAGLVKDIKGKLLETYSKAIAQAEREGRMEDVIDYYGEVIQLVPRNGSVFNDLGDAYRQTGNAEAAMAAYQRALAVSPGFYAPVQVNIGRQLLDQGLLDQAESIFLEVLAKAPTAAAASGQCSVMAAQGNADKALEACCLAVALAPEAARYTDQLVQTLLRFYRPDQALAVAGKRFAEYPEMLHPVLGGLYAALGRQKAAFETYQQSDSMLSQLRLGETALTMRDYQTADDAFARVLKDHRDHPQAKGGRCLALLHMANPEDAAPFCRQAVKDHPQEGRYLIAHADILTASHRSFEALEFYRRAYETGDPQAAAKLAEAYAGLAQVALAKGLSGDALKALRKAVAVDPGNKKLHNAIAEIYIRQERYTEALRPLERALKIDAEYTEALANKGIAAHALGREDLARATFVRAVKIDPDLTVALAGYCEFLRDTGGDAEEICRKAEK